MGSGGSASDAYYASITIFLARFLPQTVEMTFRRGSAVEADFIGNYGQIGALLCALTSAVVLLSHIHLSRVQQHIGEDRRARCKQDERTANASEDEYWHLFADSA